MLQHLKPILLAMALVYASRVNAREPEPSGQVLLLKNERLFEGDVERVGDRYRVRRGDAEVTLPIDSVAFVGPNLKSVYDFLSGKAEPTSADDHLRLARWCFTHNLRDEAIHEAEVAGKLAPNSTGARELLRQLRRADSPQDSSSLPPAVARVVDATDPINCSAEAVKLFNTKVQPILQNACLQCHGSEQGGAFRLRRSTQFADMQANLAACMKQIDGKNPAKSPILHKAITAHGGTAKPPIRDCNAIPYLHIEQWVTSVARDNMRVDSQPTLKAEIVQTSAKSQPAAAKSDVPKDPFDPVIFNRMNKGPQ